MGDFIAIRGAIEDVDRASSTKRKKRDAGDDQEASFNWWYAQVLECRAIDSNHVFIRVAYLYRPEDTDEGRTEDHGSTEVLPSNDMQILNAATVEGPVDLVKWDQELDPKTWDKDNVLVWRQTINVFKEKKSFSLPSLTKAVTSPRLPHHCICSKPADPDQALIHCASCDRWLHEHCIIDAAVRATATAPSKTATSTAKVEGGVETPPTGAEKKGSFGFLKALGSPFRSFSREPSSSPSRTKASQADQAQSKLSENNSTTLETVQEDVPNGDAEEGTDGQKPQDSQTPQSAGRAQKRKREETSQQTTTTKEQKTTKQTKQRSQAKAAKAASKADKSLAGSAALSKFTAVVMGLFGSSDTKQVVVSTAADGGEGGTLVEERPLRCLFKDCGKVIT